MILRCTRRAQAFGALQLVLAGCGFEHVQMVMPSFL